MSLNNAKRSELLEKLDDFLGKLHQLRNVSYGILDNRELSQPWLAFHELREELQGDYVDLKSVIEEYGSPARVLVGEAERDAFAYILCELEPTQGMLKALEGAIFAVKMAIGKLQSLPSNRADRQDTGPAKTKAELEDFLTKLKRFQQNRSRIGEKGDTKSLERPREELIRMSAKLRNVIAPPDGKLLMEQFGRVFDAFDEAFMLYWRPQCFAALDALIQETNVAIGRLEAAPAIGEQPTAIPVTGPPKAFIAHGGQSARLRRLCDFLRALGIEPVVAEWSESEGRWTEQNVVQLMQDSDCDIVLAEYGGIVDERTGAKHPRLNVIDELARSRERRPSRTVLLLERGVELPSNVSGIVYEHFTKQNMEKAFIKVAKELVEFGLIRATKG